MGDRADDMDIIARPESGNVEQGHISEASEVEARRTAIRGNQAGLLNNTLNNYYSENEGFLDLRQDLQQLGYTDERVELLSTAAHAERVYRLHHDNQPSELSINQLQFLAENGLNLSNGHAHIRTDERGQYYEDYRVRDESGNPGRMYLPQALEFEPLTQAQQDEFNKILFLDQAVNIPNPDTTDPNVFYQTDIPQATIHQLSQISAQYLNGEHNDETELAFINRVQSLQGLENIEGIRGKLIEYFLDINDELEYRNNNNGRPRGLTDIEWEHLQNNRNINGEYYGQPILLTHTTPPAKYFISGNTVLIIDNDIVEPTDSRELSASDDMTMNDISVDIFDNPDLSEQDIRNLLNERFNVEPDNPNDFEISLDIEDRTQRILEEREYRQNNNGKPSQLSQLQYDFLRTHTLTQYDLGGVHHVEPRYRGEPIRTIYTGSRYGTGGQRPSMIGFYPYGSTLNNTFLSLPTDDMINGFIQAGTYTPPTPIRTDDEMATPLPDPLPDPAVATLPITQSDIDPLFQQLAPPRPSPIIIPEHPQPIPSLPEDFIPITDNQLTGYIPRLPIPVEPPQDIYSRLGSDEPPLPPIEQVAEYVDLPDEILVGGDPPVIPGQTQPINLETGEDIPLDTPQSNYERYRNFFYNNQNLYKGFNEMFRDILPIFTGFTGAFASFSLSKLKHIGTIEEIIAQEKSMLNLIDVRLSNLENQLVAEKQILDSFPSIQVKADIETFNQLELIKNTPMFAFFLERQYGVEIPNTLKKDMGGGLVIIDPTALDREISVMTGRISDEMEQVAILEAVVNKLQTDIDNGLVNRKIINDRLETIINNNYQILINIQKYSPQILTGFNIGHTLGFVLGGYFFPTYIDIEADENYINDKIHLPTNQAKKPEYKLEQKKYNLPFHMTVDSKPINIYGQHSINKLKLEVETLNKSDNIFKPYLTGNRPLNMTEINDMKMTLNYNELKKLEGNMLMFQEGSKIIPKSSICRGVVGQGDLGDQSIKSRPMKIR